MNPMIDKMSDTELEDYLNSLCQVAEARSLSLRIDVSGLTDEELAQLWTDAHNEQMRRIKARWGI